MLVRVPARTRPGCIAGCGRVYPNSTAGHDARPTRGGATVTDAQTHGPILFLIPCSLTKNPGGGSRYDASGAMTSCVGADSGSRLLERREEVRGLVMKNHDLEWQGVPLARLEFNRGLVSGMDCGGRRSAAYLPAIDRYQGRFFQALGEGGRQALRERRHGALIVSGLYGLVRPMEGIQLYSCPLAAEVAETWGRDALLTDVLCEYIARFEVLRIFDLLAIDAYRQLVDWQRIADTRTDVLHCFDAMAAGESALTSFGMLLASHLLDRTEDDLIGLKDGDRIGNVTFRSTMATPAGFPAELASLLAARNESFMWQSRHVGEDVREIVRGGNPDHSPSTAPPDAQKWKFTLAKELRRDLKRQPQLLDRVIQAIMEVCGNPMSAIGNTVKPLTNELQGMWRYRIGDFRVIYEPDGDRRTVHFLGLRPRGSAYE